MGRKSQGWVWSVVVCAAGAQMLAGYDMGVIGGALLYIVPDFNLEKHPGVIGIVMTSSLVGALLGTLVAGPTADFVGRKMVLMIAGYIFFGCGALLGWSPNISTLIAGRGLLGLAIGLQSTILPLYIAECAPALIRGSLNVMPQLAVSVGIILSYFADFFVGISATPLWRLMLGLSCVPAALFLVAINFPPESPRWLVKAGRKEEAVKALRFLRGADADISDELALIVRDCHRGKVSSHLEEGLLPTPEPDTQLAPPSGEAFLIGSQSAAVSSKSTYAHLPDVQHSGAPELDVRELERGSGDSSLGKHAQVQSGDTDVHRKGLEGSTLEKDAASKDEIHDPGTIDAAEETSEANELASEGKWKALRKSWRPLALGMGLKLLQELSGISVVLYYTPVVMRESGIASIFSGGPFDIDMKSAAILATACSFSMKLPAIYLAFRFMDSAGRRIMLLSSIPFNVLSLVTLALSAAYLERGPLRAVLSLLSTSLFACAFATGLGPVPTIVISEIFPMQTRGLGQSLCFSMHWVSNIIMTEAFPILRVGIGLPWTFTMFAVLCVVAWLFVYVFMPETKGYTLEEISAKMAGGQTSQRDTRTLSHRRISDSEE